MIIESTQFSPEDQRLIKASIDAGLCGFVIYFARPDSLMIFATCIDGDAKTLCDMFEEKPHKIVAAKATVAAHGVYLETV